MLWIALAALVLVVAVARADIAGFLAHVRAALFLIGF
jgi:hypothetical protein